ncbi:MAG: hypothetical protein QOD24_4841, partial [Solirubrobacteraceae bacterium]|nr:hypothetical protein [Solirubrobacteraceae bacterium]
MTDQPTARFARLHDGRRLSY